MKYGLVIGDLKIFEARESLHAQLLHQNFWMQKIVFRAYTCRFHLLNEMVEGLTFLKRTLLCLKQFCSLCICEAVQYGLTLFSDEA